LHNLSDWKVLVVDDEPDNMGVIELVMSFYEAKVRTAESGMTCLELMEQERPTLLLVDIQMPGMSGFELLEKIRERDDWKDIPLIAVTAHAMFGDYERIIAAGFDGYIPKPISAMTLIDEIKTMLTAKVKRS
jgi:CheY-like chemotaxis protein